MVDALYSWEEIGDGPVSPRSDEETMDYFQNFEDVNEEDDATQ